MMAPAYRPGAGACQPGALQRPRPALTLIQTYVDRPLALRRPYTVAVLALLILLLGALSLPRMVVDIFPNIDIPVVVVVWSYPGLPAEDMERRVVFISERAYSTTRQRHRAHRVAVDPGHRHAEGLLPAGHRHRRAPSRRSARLAARILRILPPGMQPPIVIQFNASNVPVAQLTVSSDDAARATALRLRAQLHPRAAVHHPRPVHAGALRRQAARRSWSTSTRGAGGARGCRRSDVVNALQATNVIVPAGTARIGNTEYNVALNTSPPAVAEFRHASRSRSSDGAAGVARRRGQGHDGFADQTNIVRVNGRARDLPGDPQECGRLDARGGRRDARGAAADPGSGAAGAGAQARLRSVGLRARRDRGRGARGRDRLGAGLADDPVFLGSWRSTVIVCTSIPLAIFAAIVGL